MALGRELGLSPSDIVLDRDPAPLPQKGAEPQIFGPYLLWPNGWMDQDATWHGGRSRPQQIWAENLGLCALLGEGSSAVFAGLTSMTDRPTDHATRSVTIGRIYVRSTAMRPIIIKLPNTD